MANAKLSPLETLAASVKNSAKTLNIAPSAKRNEAISRIAKNLLARQAEILAANAKDIAAAKENGIAAAMIDRLSLTEDRIKAISAACKQVISLPDPLGKADFGTTLPNGLEMVRVKVPLGVIGIIYEARPNVTVDAAVLCLKSGNACLLKGGKEALHSNMILRDIMQQSLEEAGLPTHCIALVEDTARETTTQMMRLNGYLDVLIPRGGAGLIRAVVANATVPVIETGVGNCHIYVDETADLAMAVNIIDNAKTSRPSVCNAVETILIHEAIAPQLLPLLKEQLDKHQVTWRGCPKTEEILGMAIQPATEEDYTTEYNDYIICCKIVQDMTEALAHIDRYSTRHSEAIITNDYERSQEFTRKVDAAAVYVNASTRFTDGGEFGFGAEIGISTQKLHARGPMGLDQLTSWKYILRGNGQIRK
ncbi:MAG: glutamate-5-semialdehyde dehydrogenase [Peptococcaceae bacterium]|nr:glutamate-5-semialdehyde dehydrogenase [Peptococcaceae bacterium]